MNTKLRSLIFTSFGHFSNDSVFLVYPLLITYYTLIPGLNLVLLGSLAIVYQLVYGALSTPIGILTDRTGNEGLMITIGIAILGIGIGAFAASFAYAGLRLPFIIAGVLLLGAGTAFYHPIGASILKGTYKNKSASMMGINGSMGSLGRSIMPILLIFLITLLGASVALGLVAGELIASAAILYFGLLPFNRGFRSGANASGKTEREIARRQKAKNSNNSVFKTGYAKVLLPLVAVIFVRAMFLSGTTTFVPEYLKTVIHSEILVGTILSVSFFFAIFGQLAFGYMTSRKGGRYTIALTSFMSIVAFVLFLYSGGNAYLVLIMYSIFVFTLFNGFAVILGYVNQLVPDSIANGSNAFTWGIGQILGSAAGIAVMTAMLNFISIGNAMWYMVGFMALAIAMLPVLYLHGNKKGADFTKLKNAHVTA